MAQERPGAPRSGPRPPRSAQEWARSAQEWLRNAQEQPGPAQERPGATQERPRPPPRPGRPVSGPPLMPTATGKRMRNRRKRGPAARTGAPDPPGVRGDRFFPDGLRGVPRRDSGQVRTKSTPNPYNADPGGRSERPVVPGGKTRAPTEARRVPRSHAFLPRFGAPGPRGPRVLPYNPRKDRFRASSRRPGRPRDPRDWGPDQGSKRHEKTRYFATPVARSAVKTCGFGFLGKMGVKRTL